MEMVTANIWHFGFSLYKNIFLVLVPANIKYLILALGIVF